MSKLKDQHIDNYKKLEQLEKVYLASKSVMGITHNTYTDKESADMFPDRLISPDPRD